MDFLRRFHRDLTRFCSFRLGHLYGQHSSVVAGDRLVEIELLRQLDRARKFAERPLAAVIASRLGRDFAPSLALDRQRMTLAGDADRFGIDSRYLGYHGYSITGVENVHWWKAARAGHPELVPGIAQEALQIALERNQVGNRVHFGGIS